jgi:hypothetical protein
MLDQLPWLRWPGSQGLRKVCTSSYPTYRLAADQLIRLPDLSARDGSCSAANNTFTVSTVHFAPSKTLFLTITSCQRRPCCVCSHSRPRSKTGLIEAAAYAIIFTINIGEPHPTHGRVGRFSRLTMYLFQIVASVLILLRLLSNDLEKDYANVTHRVLIIILATAVSWASALTCKLSPRDIFSCSYFALMIRLTRVTDFAFPEF